MSLLKPSFFVRLSYLLFTILVLLILSGCSSNFKSFTESVKVAVELNKGANITPEYMASLPYASSLVTINNKKPIFVVLAFADQYDTNTPHQLTWLANDSGSIVTQHGRIMQTNGFDNNNLAGLSYSSTSANENSQFYTTMSRVPLPGDALDYPLKAIYDWSPGYRYGFTATVETRSLGRETLVTELWSEEVEHFTETVTFDQLDAQFTNHFWRVPATETVPSYIIKSIQYLGPNMDRVEMQVARPFIEPPAPTEPVSEADRFMNKRILLPKEGRFSLALQNAHRQTAFWPLHETPYPLGTALVNLSKQNWIEQQRNTLVQKLEKLNTTPANNLAKQLKEMRFAYHENINSNLVSTRVDPKTDPLLNGDYWLSLPARPNHISMLHPLSEKRLFMPSKADFHLSRYIKKPELFNFAAPLPRIHDAWVIQADRTVYYTTDLQWQDTRYYLSPGAMIFVGLEDLPHEYRDLNANIAQLLAHRLEL